MVYFLLFAFAIDIIRLLNFIVPFFPPFITVNPERTKELTSFAVIAVVLVIVLGGYINARTPRIKTLALTIPKNGRTMKTLNIAVASDIHLGTIVCKSKLEKIVERINALAPDLVLLPGDVVDEDIGPVIRNNLGETLRKIQAKYGVIAITGNHEYIGGVEPACRYLVEHGITMLRDAWVKIDDGLYVVGREDISIRGFTGKTRKPLRGIDGGSGQKLPHHLDGSSAFPPRRGRDEWGRFAALRPYASRAIMAVQFHHEKSLRTKLGL